MKKGLKSTIKFLCVAFLFIGVISCDNSSLEVDEELNDLNSTFAKKKGNNGGLVFNGECDATTVNLIAGQHINVGTVSVEVEGDNYIITYSVEAGWCITETHLNVEEQPQNFPMTGSGNPKIGHFEYSNSHDCISEYSYKVPVSEGTYIAAHAVVNCSSDPIGEFADNLPNLVNACTTAKGEDANNAYFDLTINNTSLAGDYAAWCVDVDKSLSAGECFDADVYSSYETLPEGEFENPENFDSVNWLMNQNYIGQPSPLGGNYTFGDIQWAIWELIDNENCVNCAYLGDDWDIDRATELYNLALNNGDGFVPECEEIIAVILIPTNGKQSLIIPQFLPCVDTSDCEETAWAEGCDFPGNSWAMYFNYSE